MRVLLDANVVLDVLLSRDSWLGDARVLCFAASPIPVWSPAQCRQWLEA
jgi:hypothetical protein